MAPAAASPFVLILGAVLVANAFLTQPETRLVRTKRKANETFSCSIPSNISALAPYITCKMMNEAADSYNYLVFHDDPRPSFGYAVFCANASGGAEHDDGEDAGDGREVHDEGNDGGERNSGENGDDSSGGSSSGESSECLDGEYDDCSVQCVYNKTGVLDEKGLPDEHRLYEHMITILNSDKAFKKIARYAVKSCYQSMQETVEEYGLDNVNLCLLSYVMLDCVEYEIGQNCPKHNRSIPKKKTF